MRGDLLGGGVVVAVAAALWLIYLVPTWLHRREYLATERNAVRLQQTLRILAETAETPREVHLEATAREVARQRKALKAAQRVAEAQAREAAEQQAKLIAERQLRESAAASRIARPRAVAARPEAGTADAARMTAATDTPSGIIGAYADVATADARRAARLRRRLRALSSFGMLVSLAAAAWGGVWIAVDGTWPLLAGSVATLACFVVALNRLAAPSARTVAPAAAAPESSELFDHADHPDHAEHGTPEVPQEASTWTPRPLPKPLHLSRGTIAASAMASVDAAVELRRAAARAELDRKAAGVEPELPRLRPAAEQAIAASAQSLPRASAQSSAHREPELVKATGTDGRYATMGVVGTVGGSRLDLDAVLRRRRG
ncbi:MAG TPA: hypothetical protein VN133_05470 [Humibacter sp.]|nr:hypothetical protein [Humibacter sp.]